MDLTEEEKRRRARRRTGEEEEEEEEEEEGKNELENLENDLDFKTYPGHELVLRYLRCYSDEFDLEQFVRYGRELVRASPVFSSTGGGGGGGGGGAREEESPLPWPRWRVVTRATVPAGETGDAFLPFHPPSSSPPSSSSSPDEGCVEEVFDALVCCSGHFARPRLPPSALAATRRKRQKSPLAFPGLILHAHSYRGPGVGPLAKALERRREEGNRETVVAVVGAGPSGEDIAREVSGVADRVLLCSASWEGVPCPKGAKQNIEPRPFVVRLDALGVHFGGRDEGGGEEKDNTTGDSDCDGVGDGEAPSHPSPSVSSPSFPPPERVDAVIYATGYLYDFPELSGTIAVEDNEVLQAGGGAAAARKEEGEGDGGGDGDGDGDGEQRRRRRSAQPLPLWEHLFCPGFSVGLSLLGLPFKVVPFPLVEAQARLVARALALVPSTQEQRGEGREEESPAAFPQSAQAMAAAALAASRERDEQGVARRHTHRMGCPSHFEYIERLIDAALDLGGGGGPSSPSENWRLAPWRQSMYIRASEARRQDADSYRDTADLGEEIIKQAEAEAGAWLAWRKKRRREGEG